MKRIVSGAGVAAAALLAATAVQAQAAHGLEIGVQTYGYGYRESFALEDGTAGRIDDEGRFVGFTVEYGRAVGAWSVDVRFRYAGAEVDYRSSDGDTLKAVPQQVGQLELLLGRPFRTSGAVTLTPYIGLGGRVLNDESGGRVTNTGLEGYDREVSYSYVPLGAASRYVMSDGAELAVHGQFNWIVGGSSKSDLREQGGPLLDLEFENGHGWEFGATYSRPFAGGRLGFGPFLRRWSLDESAPARFEEDGDTFEVVEPANRTTEIGLKLVYGF